jgi:hypothetical protein
MELQITDEQEKYKDPHYSIRHSFDCDQLPTKDYLKMG